MKISKLQAIILVVAPALLGGCTSLRNDYVEPTAGGFARLSVVNATHLMMRLDLYDDPLTCSGRRMVIQRNTPFDPPSKTPSVKVTAGIPLTFTLLSGADTVRTSETCAPTVTFTPKEGIDYHAYMIVLGDKCLVKMTAGDDTAMAPPEAKQRTWRNGLTESASFCKPD